jgi:hypothetical protein
LKEGRKLGQMNKRSQIVICNKIENVRLGLGFSRIRIQRKIYNQKGSYGNILSYSGILTSIGVMMRRPRLLSTIV